MHSVSLLGNPLYYKQTNKQKNKKNHQYVPYTRTFKLQTFKDANVRSHIQSHKLAHVSGVHGHVCASFTSDCAFMYFTVQYHIEYSIFISRPGCPEASVKTVVM